MFGAESLLVDLAVSLVGVDGVNAFFRDPRTTARIIGVCIAVAAGGLGTILVLRGMALTSDAISHTVLLGIVVAFIVMTRVFGLEPDLSSPWLIVGAAVAGVATVVLTETIQASGLMKQDAALGLAFPFLFALAVIFIARFVDNVHMDSDAVMVGEIGVAWADTNTHPIGEYETVVITPEDPRAEFVRRCTNCVAEGISPRDPAAEFVESCRNCGTYSPGQAYRAGLIDERPVLVHWPKSVTVTAAAAVLALAFLGVFYKELKITTFDPALARSLGYHPAALNLALMVVVSLVAVAAFDAVGSILVIAFFIIPPAAAYLLTDRLSAMLGLSIGIGAMGAYWGYDLARGRLFGVVPLPGEWDTSISASMVLTMFVLFVVVFLVSPRHGLLARLAQRHRRAIRFREMVLLELLEHRHRVHDEPTVSVEDACRSMRWQRRRIRRVVRRLAARGAVERHNGGLVLRPAGRDAAARFRRELRDQATPA